MQSTVETTLVKLLSDEDALRKQMVDLCKLIDKTPKDELPRLDVCRRRLFTDKLFELASRSFGPSVVVGRKIRPQGVVTYWNDDRGFGFVRLDERFNGEVSDAFVHFRSLIEVSPRRLDKDRRVECD
jgi:cold shock CspA family protein